MFAVIDRQIDGWMDVNFNFFTFIMLLFIIGTM